MADAGVPVLPSATVTDTTDLTAAAAAWVSRCWSRRPSAAAAAACGW